MKTKNTPPPVGIVVNKFFVLGFIAMFITTIGLGIFCLIRPIGASPTPGTCWPIEKGGTSCDDTELVKYFANALYPVGSILTTTTNTNPSDYLGGNWEAFGEGRTLVGVGSNGVTNYTSSNAIGGVDNIAAHTHGGGGVQNGTLAAAIGSTAANVNELGFQHYDPPYGVAALGNATYSITGSMAGSNRSFSHFTRIAGNTASGGGHDNRMSYITVYFWKRTL